MRTFKIVMAEGPHKHHFNLVEHELNRLLTNYRDRVLDLLNEEYLLSDGLRGELSPLRHYNISELIKIIFHPGTEGAFPLFIKTYYRPSSAVGKTYPPDPTIWVNTRFISQTALGRMRSASNLVHEFSHLLGAEHDFSNTARRDYSLSYLLNRVIERAWGEYYELPNHTTVRRSRWWWLNPMNWF